MTFYCIVDEEDTKFTGTLEFNGYSVGDRLLEDVIFLADVVEGELQEDTVRVEENSAEYFASLDTEKWLAAVLEGIENYDVYTLYSSPLDVGDEGGDEIWRTS